MKYDNLSAADFKSLNVAKKNGLFSPEEFDSIVETANTIRGWLGETNHSAPFIATGGNLLRGNGMFTRERVLLTQRICVGESIEFHVAAMIAVQVVNA